MTDEQIKQNAEAYCDENFSPLDVDRRQYAEEDFIAGAHSRDEEIEELKNEASAIMDEASAVKIQLDKLHNPWISVKEHPDDVTKDYLLKYEDGSHIIAMWDSGMWMSKDLHPLKNPVRWMLIPN